MNIKSIISISIALSYVAMFLYLKYLNIKISNLEDELSVSRANATYDCIKTYTDKELGNVKKLDAVIDSNNSTIDFDQLW